MPWPNSTWRSCTRRGVASKDYTSGRVVQKSGRSRRCVSKISTRQNVLVGMESGRMMRGLSSGSKVQRNLGIQSPVPYWCYVQVRARSPEIKFLLYVVLRFDRAILLSENSKATIARHAVAAKMTSAEIAGSTATGARVDAEEGAVKVFASSADCSYGKSFGMMETESIDKFRPTSSAERTEIRHQLQINGKFKLKWSQFPMPS